MRINIDLTPAVQKRAGVGRYAEQLATHLLDMETGDELCLFYTDRQGRAPCAPLDTLPRRSITWPNKPWRMSALLSSFTGLPMDRVVGPGDVFHATDHLLPRLGGMRSVFTLHDLSFLTNPESHLPANARFLRLMVPRFLRQADAVICISEHTRDDAVRCYNLDLTKTHVIGEGVDKRFKPILDPTTTENVRQRYHLPERFLLFVGTIEPRKNIGAILEALAALRAQGRPEKLVLVGRKGWLYQSVFDRLRALNLQDSVILPGYVADEDLPAIYNAAQVFVFPSLYEGFGLPPLEALACGVPVVCSNSSSLPEVCGDAALLVQPEDVGALVAALRRALDDEDLRRELRSRGLRQAARFSWQRMAAETHAVYRSLARRRGEAGV